MLVTEYQYLSRVSSEHYNGMQQWLDGMRAVFSAALSQYGYVGNASTNGKVSQAGTPSPSAVSVAPALLFVPITVPTPSGGAPFATNQATPVTVPALNTTAGQSRQDLVVAKLNVGQVDTYLFTVVQGTPASTGTQVDPAVPDNALVLARITRAHGHGNIVDGNITDLRVPLKLSADHVA